MTKGQPKTTRKELRGRSLESLIRAGRFRDAARPAQQTRAHRKPALASACNLPTPVESKVAAPLPCRARIYATIRPMEKIRLSKRMSELGLCSRREADSYIENGWVYVDGERITELGTRIYPEQAITLNKAAQSRQLARVTILLNKPIGYVSGQAEDGYHPAISLIRAESRWHLDRAPTRFHPSQLKGLAPAGRLDIDSQGLLVLTQDGRIAKQLVGENSMVEKEYLVRVQGTLSDRGLALLNHGLELDGQALKVADVRWQNEGQLRFILREGKKRQIRRMCELVGLKAIGLKRVRIGQIKLGALPESQWRYLVEGEQF
jgi:23S rRNA pseudouridine2604 synthase